jgi:hypothetical protein
MARLIRTKPLLYRLIEDQFPLHAFCKSSSKSTTKTDIVSYAHTHVHAEEIKQ